MIAVTKYLAGGYNKVADWKVQVRLGLNDVEVGYDSGAVEVLGHCHQTPSIMAKIESLKGSIFKAVAAHKEARVGWDITTLYSVVMSVNKQGEYANRQYCTWEQALLSDGNFLERLQDDGKQQKWGINGTTGNAEGVPVNPLEVGDVVVAIPFRHIAIVVGYMQPSVRAEFNHQATVGLAVVGSDEYIRGGGVFTVWCDDDRVSSQVEDLKRKYGQHLTVVRI